MTSAREVPGSYRDPRGRVYIVGDRVLRTVMPPAVEDFDFVRGTGLIRTLAGEGLVVPEERVDPKVLGPDAEGARYVIEHPKLPFVSYPYEWSFEALKAAAVLHLDVHLRALACGVNLSDASAYNIQFEGTRPVFIDSLSFRRYQEGEFWLGHHQFCEQFLNPLLLRSVLGVPHNAWYRGNLEGIGVQDLSDLLPLRRKLSWNIFTHVVLQASLERSAKNRATTKAPAKMNLPRSSLERMLRGLRKWISGMRPGGSAKTVWSDYAQDNTYLPTEEREKRAFVARFTSSTAPRILWDIGCNTGDYARVALDAGAGYVVGFDFDHGALEAAFRSARENQLNFLPLFLDVVNPSPDQGWAEMERQGLAARGPADGILALALVHHLAIARNIPLDQVVGWLLRLAPRGVVEFVPKSDPMVQKLLRLREDIFPDYTEEAFTRHLESGAEIVESVNVSGTGRQLFRYDRSPAP